MSFESCVIIISSIACIPLASSWVQMNKKKNLVQCLWLPSTVRVRVYCLYWCPNTRRWSRQQELWHYQLCALLCVVQFESHSFTLTPLLRIARGPNIAVETTWHLIQLNYLQLNESYQHTCWLQGNSNKKKRFFFSHRNRTTAHTHTQNVFRKRKRCNENILREMERVQKKTPIRKKKLSTTGTRCEYDCRDHGPCPLN